MNSKIETVELFPEVIVYKNMFPRIKEITKAIIDSEFSERTEDSIFAKWTEWYTFGTQMSFPFDPDLQMEDLQKEVPPMHDGPLGEDENPEVYISKAISTAFYNATMHYIKKHNLELPNWSKMGLTVCKYNSGQKDYAMAYHTDNSGLKKDEPGEKFFLTCTIYLNDDYEGGEVSFLDMNTKQVVEYNPYEGDVVVFPSSEPFYHGVNEITSGAKYFIRLFWTWKYDGSEEWFENEKKYGVEEWRKKDTARVKKEIWNGKWHRDVVWNEEEMTLSKYIPNDDYPTLTPVYSPFPKIKRGKGNE